MQAYIAGAERIEGAKPGAPYRLPDSPWRLAWHTTEVVPSSVDGARDLARRHATPPHLWAWPEKDWVGQTVPLTLSAYALLHPPGTPETNHRHAIQVEVIGYARDAPCRVHADWLGRRVLRPILDAGVPIRPFHTAPSTGSDGAGTDGAVRQSAAWWAAFDGQCGHANVPDNEHWDPGFADYQAIARAAAEEDDMSAEDVAAIKAHIDAAVKKLVGDPGTPGATLTRIGQLLHENTDGLHAEVATRLDRAGLVEVLADPDVVRPLAAAIVAEAPGGDLDAAQIEAALLRVLAKVTFTSAGHLELAES